ncbi:transcriptional regulator, partial [Streptomyces sp. SID8455]|nr:transcriptional regulator [Streptomyces sp. SID8455]
MPFRLHFGESDLLRCRFALSPLWETQEAVRTLARPHRHGYHLPWLRRIRADAWALDLEPLWLLMPDGGH